MGVDNDSNKYLTFEIISENQQLISALVKVSPDLVNKMYHNSLVAYSLKTRPKGLITGSTPISYIEKNFKATIVEQLKSFIFWYSVISFLHKKIRQEKLIIAGEPRLKENNPRSR